MRRPRARDLMLPLALAAAPAGAQNVVRSAGADHVGVTIYRQPGRSPQDAPELGALGGFALISETRRISIPAGESEIRFEGVAAGMFPPSVMVSGLPEGVIERNRDDYLLAPATLMDRSLGRHVHLRRTARATGAVVEQDAILRSGADGAVVLQTAEGFESLRCTGLPETVTYSSVPDGLFVRPTLSVRARSSRPVTATITLAYLAQGFDWQANYIANLAPDGAHLDLFAWLTLASDNDTSFPNADAQAVAGRLYREHGESDEGDVEPIELNCWPQGRTSDIPLEGPPRPVAVDRRGLGYAGTADQINDLPMNAESIVVTGSRLIRPEELGDLKLYRLPEPVTVAAHSQKQVSFLEQRNVRVDLVYRSRLDPGDTGGPEPAHRMLVTRNRIAEGLGLPLPAGRIVLFAGARERPVVVGEDSIADRAVGEDVEIDAGEAEGITTTIESTESGDDWEDYLLTVTNDRPAPVRFEAEFAVEHGHDFRPRRRLARHNGNPLWRLELPANGTATLRYRLVELPEPPDPPESPEPEA